MKKKKCEHKNIIEILFSILFSTNRKKKKLIKR